MYKFREFCVTLGIKIICFYGRFLNRNISIDQETAEQKLERICKELRENEILWEVIFGVVGFLFLIAPPAIITILIFILKSVMQVW